MHTSRKVISAVACATALATAHAFAWARPASVVTLDAQERAGGNRKSAAVAVGRRLFATVWPAQVLKVYVDGTGSHAVAGIRISGVKFHRALDRRGFAAEVADVATQTLAAAPLEEVDIYAVVPLSVGKGVVVAGDSAKPSSRTVFAVTVRRGESRSALFARLQTGRLAYWDQDWAGRFLK